MSKHTHITMADLGLTPGEADLFASGARHLFGAPETDETEPVPKPIARPKPVPKGALAKVNLGSRPSPGSRPVAKKSKVVG